jgi:hypothetical protein
MVDQVGIMEAIIGTGNLNSTGLPGTINTGTCDSSATIKERQPKSWTD